MLASVFVIVVVSCLLWHLPDQQTASCMASGNSMASGPRCACEMLLDQETTKRKSKPVRQAKQTKGIKEDQRNYSKPCVLLMPINSFDAYHLLMFVSCVCETPREFEHLKTLPLLLSMNM